MAGGRRPANFATSAARHIPSDQSYYSIWQNPHISSTGTVSPTAPARTSALPGGASFPLLTSLSSPVPGEIQTVETSGIDGHVVTPADALAAALDTAVSVAVSRALANKQTTCAENEMAQNLSRTDSFSPGPKSHQYASGFHCSPRSTFLHEREENDHAESVASSSFNHVVGSNSSRNSSAGGEVFPALESQIETESQNRKQDIEDLRALVEQLELRFSATEKEDRTRISSLEERLTATEIALTDAVENERKQAAECLSLREQLRASQKSLNELRFQKRKSDSDTERVRARLSDLESRAESYEQKIEPLLGQMEKWEEQVQGFTNITNSSEEVGNDCSERSSQALRAAEMAGRTANEVLENVSGLRSRLKRLEASNETRSKRIDESLALQGGAIDSIRSTLLETSTSVQGLKRLVEANLRSHSSAEGIVKDQAQLITRHVCVALRQFISRRITENNMLIDTTLRARIPAYAEAGDEFVLVREHEKEGRDDSEVPSIPVAQGGRQRENVAVLRRDVLETAIADFGENGSVGGEQLR